MEKEKRISYIFLENASIFRKWIDCLYSDDGNYNIKATLDDELKSRVYENTPIEHINAIDCMNAIDYCFTIFSLFAEYLLTLNKWNPQCFEQTKLNFDEINSTAKILVDNKIEWNAKYFKKLDNEKINTILYAPIGFNGILLKELTYTNMMEYIKCVREHIKTLENKTNKDTNKTIIPKVDFSKLGKKIPMPNYLTTLKNQSTKKSIQKYVDAKHQFAIELADNGNEIFEIDNAILCNVLYFIGQDIRKFTDEDIYKVWNKGRNIKITKQTTQFIEESINKATEFKTRVSFTMNGKKYVAQNVDYMPLHITDEISNGKRIRYYQAKTDNYSDQLLEFIQSQTELMQKLGNKSIDEIKALPMAYIISIMQNQYHSINANYFNIPNVKQNKISISIASYLAKRIEWMRHNQQKGIIKIDSLIDGCNIDIYTNGKKDKKKKYNALIIIGKILEHYTKTPISDKNNTHIISNYLIDSKNGTITIDIASSNKESNTNNQPRSKSISSGIYNKLDAKTKNKINALIKNKTELKKDTLIEYINIRYDDKDKTIEENINDICNFIDGTFTKLLKLDDGQKAQSIMETTIKNEMAKVQKLINNIYGNAQTKEQKKALSIAYGVEYKHK